MTGRWRSWYARRCSSLCAKKSATSSTGCVDADVVGGDLGHRAGQQNDRVVGAVLRVFLDEHLLVGEDVAFVTEDVVELPERVVEEAWRPGDREHPRRLEVVDVAERPVELPIPLLLAERGLGGLRQLVDHRVPDRTGELQQVRVNVAELGEPGQVGRARVVLVEQPDAVVLDPQRRVADRPVGRGGERLDHHLEPAVELDHVVGRGLQEVPEAELLELVAQLRGRELGQQHGRLLRHEPLQLGRVEVVAVQMGHVQVVAVTEALPVQLGVVREREPGGEIGRVDPRITQDAAGRGVDPQARVPGTGDAHRASSTGSLLTGATLQKVPDAVFPTPAWAESRRMPDLIPNETERTPLWPSTSR